MVLDDVAPIAGYPHEYGLLLAALQDGTNEWKWELGEPSEDAIVWQPFPGSHSIGGIMLHNAYVELGWFQAWSLGRPLSDEDNRLFMVAETDVDEVRWPTPHRQPWSWYWEMLQSVRARTFELVKDFPEPDATFEIWGRKRTFRWTLAHVVEHESYHAGQAVLLHIMHQRMAAGS